MILAARPTAPHYAKPVRGDCVITVEELAWDGALIEDEVERLLGLAVHYVMDEEEVPFDRVSGDSGYTAYSARLVGAEFKGRYLSPRQCAEILPREIRIEARAAAERQAEQLNGY